MLERRTHPNGLITYHSPLLTAKNIPHAFSTRHGGASSTPFASLNFGNSATATSQDPPANIAENVSRLLAALNLPATTPRAWVTQVHGRRVELLEREPENEYAETLDAELRDRFSGQLSADALVSTVPGVLLTIRIADCVPLLIASADGAIVAAVHAGWRGIVGNIAAKAVRTLHEAAPASAAPHQLIAAIGPCISAEHFEVGEEVAAEFYHQNLEPAVLKHPTAKPHIDLQLALKLQLERAGLTTIETNNLCTYQNAEDFYSHRRDHGTTGRMIAAITPILNSEL